jgi:hypothetical protein
MAINYTWNVSTVDTYPTLESNADVVYNVHWRLTAEDDTLLELTPLLVLEHLHNIWC